jgi:hypothetical protein
MIKLKQETIEALLALKDVPRLKLNREQINVFNVAFKEQTGNIPGAGCSGMCETVWLLGRNLIKQLSAQGSGKPSVTIIEIPDMVVPLNAEEPLNSPENSPERDRVILLTETENGVTASVMIENISLSFLQGKTTKELKQFADEVGVEYPKSANKAVMLNRFANFLNK